MRTRSVQLVTSWWVVCVWAAVSLATGLVSVVAVLQPAWYVRYSQIHAQDVQGVAFQVGGTLTHALHSLVTVHLISFHSHNNCIKIKG